MPIKDLPLHLRPQEKALLQGIDSLNELELLALILRNGSASSDALQLASNLLQRFGNIKSLLDAPIEGIQKVRGIGKVKALQLKSIQKITSIYVNFVTLIFISTSSMVDFAHSHISDFTRENFLVVLLNRNNGIIYFENMYRGTQNQVSFSPKEVVSLAITKNATKFFCVHNHPSGDVKPSKNDVILTRKLSYISELLGIEFSAHIIINSNKDYQLISW